MVRLRIGELLIAANVITEAQLAEALSHPKGSGERVGDALLQLGYVDETALTQTLSQQLSVPWVSLYHVEFSRQLLDLVPRRLAEQFCLIPVMKRKSKSTGDTLYVAMDDPTHESALRAVARFAEMPTRAMIACRSDIQNAIRVYYATGSASQPPKPMTPAATSGVATGRITRAHDRLPTFVSEPPPAAPSSEAPPPAPSQAPGSVDRPSAAPEIELAADDLSQAAARESRQRSMVALTMLDGTTISLPSRKQGSGASPAHGEGLTTRDLISALRAEAHGADASEILGDGAKWQAMFATLLSLMLRKGLIADWEFVEEFRKI